ncbi:MAG: aldehyde dehydrogenase family protein [Candidatus Omnitrophica bacterium]|nr:aldehyde dehydrogenase family protein [Candidatus Omnitrophota bacterium]
MNTKLLVNGELRETGEKQEVIDPSCGEVITEVCVASSKEIELALQSARDGFDKGAWPGLSLKERKEFILKISQGILDNAQELASLETLNTGKPIKESTFMDIPSAAKTFEHFANNLEKYLEQENIAISAATGDSESRLSRQPQGVVVLIVPWNYPLLIASWKMAQALAAGNTVILKPSSLTPLTALKLAEIIQGAGLPDGSVNILNGPGQDLGEALCSDKRVDMVSFTGSNEVGKEIINYSSRNVKKLIMELGGKSAGIIFKDADLESAVNGSLCSVFLNQGQMCTAMSRIFVEDGIYDRFIENFVAKARRIKLGRGEDFETQMGPLISEYQRGKVLEYVEKAKKEGAKLLCGGRIPVSEKLKNGFFLEPAVFSGVNPGMKIFREEVFGPVSCVSRFSGAEEAVSLANNTDFALASAVWTRDLKKANELALRLNAGCVWINTYGMFYNEAPYGGFKQSGFGKELGKEGFLEYTFLKNIITDKALDSKPLVNYWYGF